MLNTIFESPLVGHGFGKEVTFQTDDPRIRQRSVGRNLVDDLHGVGLV